MFAKNLPFRIGSVRLDVEGRYIVMEVTLGEITLILGNVYGPNEDDPHFYIRFYQVVEARENDSILLAGDFNASMDPVLDLFNNQGLNHARKRVVIQEFNDLKGLVDVWRIKNPGKKTFTWRKPNTNNLVMSRLDYFFVSEDLVLRTKNTAILPRYNSDHCRLSLQLDLSVAKRGRGYWKFNNLHLSDPYFLQIMNDTILRELWGSRGYKMILLMHSGNPLKVS